MPCPNCGAAVEGKRFCSQCGFNLQKTQSSPRPEPLPVTDVSDPGPLENVRLSKSSGEREDPLIGRTLDQKYLLETQLGLGGMGTVYRARRVLIGDVAAVKILHAEQMRDKRAVERFRRETQAAARLKHPNAVMVYDTGEFDDGRHYFVMELIEGQNLRDILRHQGPIKQGAAAEITRQICAALDEAHRLGIVHRDLKPENIVVQQTPQGPHVKVLDFGVASLTDPTMRKLTQTGGIVGTPHYMSPEHCLGEELDGRADVYSLGITLFEMLTGVVPFNSPTPTAIVVQHVNQPPPPLRSINLSISPAVEAVVLRALAKRREDRPHTAGALAQELLAAAGVASRASHPTVLTTPSDSVPTPAEAVPTPEWGNLSLTPSGAAPATKPNRMLVPLLLGALLLVACIGVALWWYGQKGETTAAGTAAPTTSNPPAIGSSPPPGAAKLWEVIPGQTSKATNIESVLAEPDEQMAIIMPDGQLALAYVAGQFFGDGAGVDLRIYGHEGDQGVYSISLRDDPNEEWREMDVNRRGFPRGVDEHDIHEHGVRRARQIMIKNIGATELHLDAIGAVYKDTISSTEEPHRHR